MKPFPPRAKPGRTAPRSVTIHVEHGLRLPFEEWITVHSVGDGRISRHTKKGRIAYIESMINDTQMLIQEFNDQRARLKRKVRYMKTGR